LAVADPSVMAVYRSGLTLAYANDMVDGGGRVRSNILEAPPSGVKTANAINQQQAKNAELMALFDKNNPSTSVTLGKSSYSELSASTAGSAKLINTASLSDAALQREVFDYAQKLAGGKALTPTTRQGVWNVKLEDGTTINARNFSSSGVDRWTIDVVRSPNLKDLGYSKNNNYELKFK
jgi:hypothetical protein